MTSMINWGILAPGRIAHKFAQDLGLVKNARLHAVASRSLDRAQTFAKQYSAEHAFGNYEELVNCPNLDVVYVASPHSGHMEHTIMLLENKIPVLCEKPLAINSKQVQKMVAAAQQNDTFFMEAIWTRFIPLFEKVSDMVGEGVIGKLNSMRADFGYKAKYDPNHRLFHPPLGGGSLLDVGLYPVFAATHFLGKPESVRAVATFGPTGTDNNCGMLFRYAEGEVAILDSSLINETHTIAVLYGEKGKITLHTRFHETEHATLSIYGEKEKSLYIPKTGFGYSHEIKAVNECLFDGQKECPKLPKSFSMQLMENLDWVRNEAGIIYQGID